MKSSIVRVVLAFACFAGALGAQDKPGAEPDPEEMTKAPFTAQQIHEFTKPGRKYVFRVEEQGEPAVFNVIEFLTVTDEGANMRQVTLDAAKKPVGEPEPEELVTWEDLVLHATFPKAQTTVTEAEVTVPAGKFQCLVYTVREPEVTTVYTFAKDLPGAPIKVETREGEKVVLSMVLTEHINKAAK
jgi:hypothetical protein